jgi:hypothetical protein
MWVIRYERGSKMATQPTCKERINQHLKSRIHDLDKLFRLYQSGDEVGDEDLGTFNEYGLGFDYVAPHTFKDQRRGYFRYQLSYGGPADEFRFYTDENLNPTRIEYWFLDWFDGAKIILKDRSYQLLNEIFDDFKDAGIVQNELYKAETGS